MDKIEQQHPGEFLAGSENDAISRETGVLAANQTVKDGQIMAFGGVGGTQLVAHDGSLATDGSTSVAGIIIGGHATGAGETKKVAYIARLREVKEALLTYPEESTAGGEKAAVDAALDAKFIVRR